MTVNETLIVCKVLQENGYGDCVMTTECGNDELSEYVDYINDKQQCINMEGWFERDNDLPINQLIHKALGRN